MYKVVEVIAGRGCNGEEWAGLNELVIDGNTRRVLGKQILLSFFLQCLCRRRKAIYKSEVYKPI